MVTVSNLPLTSAPFNPPLPPTSTSLYTTTNWHTLQERCNQPLNNQHLADIWVGQRNGQTTYTGEWQTGSLAQRLVNCPNESAFSLQWQTLFNQGFRLSLVKAYPTKTDIAFFALFSQTAQTPAFLFTPDWNLFQHHFDQYKIALTLSDLQIIEFQHQTWYLGVWHRRNH